ncbi:MAG TPA: OmpA family protein [Bryobacteraceae bacterium]|nr:OmpA family protein [Bryobacteraceae bacterium]
MKALLATTIVVTAALLAGGCATKKYVHDTTAPIQAKVDQVGDQTTQNSQQIQSTKNDLKQLDEKATNGINAAKEMATTADHHAADADRHAGDADHHAADALAKAGQADAKADADMQALRTVVANIDDYKVQTAITVLFGFDQFKLADGAQADLDKLAAAAKADNRFFLVVEGFTDKTGNKEYNEALSRRRANEVVQYLVAKCDIPIYRIHMIGLGDQKPVDGADTREARARNRRVEVKVFTADGVAASLGK